ncbi:ABC transporter permease [Streptomyces sp. NPDC005180]|uniref:ABC transporter permease n=1 Tax=Streptomyces sp. NPDC005180 TaxID=3156868 RepID=UPI0033AECB05
MLVHSKGGRWAAWSLFGILFVPLFALPLLVVVAASFSSHWSGAFPSGPTAENYASAVRGESLQALTTSLVTALAASFLALTAGTWAALAAAGLDKSGGNAEPGRGAKLGRRGKRALDALFMLPVAVPSVVVGLAVLVAFSKPPLLLNGTSTIVVLAHTILVTAFAYQSVSAALVRLDPAYEQAAASLGARPAYVLWRVRLPLLLPSLTAAAGLCFALSMGELSATMMLYPPDWMPLPVRIFTATDRGSLFAGSAVAVVLMAATLLVLLAVSRIRTRASYR